MNSYVPAHRMKRMSGEVKKKRAILSWVVRDIEHSTDEIADLCFQQLTEMGLAKRVMPQQEQCVKRYESDMKWCYGD